MRDYVEDNQEAVEHASNMAGECLQEIGKTDLATFTPDEWFTLIKVIASGFMDKSV